MRSVAALLIPVVAAVTALAAQEPKVIPEIRAFTGTQIATGSQRNLFGDSPLFGMEAAMEVRPTVHVVASLGWVPSHTTYAFINDNVNIFQYTLGLEVGLSRLIYGGHLFKPFFSIGAGARTYAYSATGVPDMTCSAGYAGIGAELQAGNTALRLQVRDNIFCYQSPMTGVLSETRNDVGLSLGVAYHIW